MSAVKDLIEGIDAWKSEYYGQISPSEALFGMVTGKLTQPVITEAVQQAEAQITQALRQIVGKCWTHNPEEID